MQEPRATASCQSPSRCAHARAAAADSTCPIRGTDNAVKGKNNAVKGTDNAVKGTDNAVKGTDNAVKGSENGVKGTDNAVKGTDNAVKSSENGVKGSDNAVKGTDNAGRATASGSCRGSRGQYLHARDALCAQEVRRRTVAALLALACVVHKELRHLAKCPPLHTLATTGALVRAVGPTRSTQRLVSVRASLRQ